MSEKVYRTAIYTRLSKDDGDKLESNSIVSQKEICEEYVRNHPDLKWVETFVDNGYSGVSFDRPDFRRMEQMIREGKIDAIICKDLSRFSRNYIEAGRYLEKIFPQLGIRFIAVNDLYDTLTGNTQSDSFLIPFKNLINDTYCRDISVKIRSNLDVKRRNGQYVGAYTPYGYKKSEEDKNHLVVDEYAAEIVQSVFSMFKDGMSIGRIADKLNATGVPSPMEYKLSEGISYHTLFKQSLQAKWSYNAVKRILTNEIYIGVMVQGKTGTPNYKVRKLQSKDEGEWIKVENAVEPIIRHDDFLAVKMMLGRDMRSTTEDSDVNLLSGFVYCADCGQTMIRKTVPSKKKKYFYYVCASSKKREKHLSQKCSSHSISIGKVEEAVLHAVQDQIDLVLNLEDVIRRSDLEPSFDRKKHSYETQVTKLEEEIERYQNLKLRLYEDLSDGVLNKKEYMEFRNRYSALIEQKRDYLAKVKREWKDASITGVTDRQWVSLFKEYETIEELNRRVLMSLVDRVLIHENHGITVVFRYQDEIDQALNYVESLADERDRNDRKRIAG